MTRVYASFTHTVPTGQPGAAFIGARVCEGAFSTGFALQVLDGAGDWLTDRAFVTLAEALAAFRAAAALHLTTTQEA